MWRECIWCETPLNTVYVEAQGNLIWCIGCVAEHIARFWVLYPDAVLVYGQVKYHLLATDEEEEPWLKAKVST